MAEKAVPALQGVRETRALLRKYAPDIAKELNAEVRLAVKELTTIAKGEVPTKPPLSNWQTTASAEPRQIGTFTSGKTGYTAARYSRAGNGWAPWVSGEIKRGIRQKQGRKRKYGEKYSNLILLVNASAAGNIFELMGRRNQPTNKSGANLIKVVNERFGLASRVIWRTVDTVGKEKVNEAVLDAYKRAEKQLQTRLDLINAGATMKTSAESFTAGKTK